MTHRRNLVGRVAGRIDPQEIVGNVMLFVSGGILSYPSRDRLQFDQQQLRIRADNKGEQAGYREAVKVLLFFWARMRMSPTVAGIGCS
jgi:hypothetical protein